MKYLLKKQYDAMKLSFGGQRITSNTALELSKEEADQYAEFIELAETPIAKPKKAKAAVEKEVENPVVEIENADLTIDDAIDSVN